VDLRSQLIQAPQQRQRRSIRLKDYDYTQEGAYFVTICTQNHKPLLGEIKNAEMVLNEYGKIVADCWQWLSKQYRHVELDEWVLMPNHMHGIVLLCRGGSRTAPTGIYKPLGRLIGAFKTTSTKRINALRRTPGNRIWQRNYYEHVIRNEDDLNEIRQYILDNPVQWDKDENNPTRQLPEPPYDNMVGAQNFVPLRQGDKVCLTR
jgi:REP element-mobilizing transposase RayT